LKDGEIEDIDIGYWSVMYLGKMNNLKELSLNLDNNNIRNEGLVKLILCISNLVNLTSLNLEI